MGKTIMNDSLVADCLPEELPDPPGVTFDRYELLAIDEALHLLLKKIEKKEPRNGGDKMMLESARSALAKVE